MINRTSPYNKFRAATRGLEPGNLPFGTGAVKALAAVNNGVKFHPQGLTVPDNLNRQDWAELGRTLGDYHKGIQWWLGDWWRFGDYSYGERAKKIAEGLLPYSFDTLMVYGVVSGSFAPLRRIKELSFSHHQAVASRRPEEQDEWLKKAARRGWSVARLKAAIKSASLDLRTDEELASYWYTGAVEVADRATESASNCVLGPDYAKLLSSSQLTELRRAVERAARGWSTAEQEILKYATDASASRNKQSRTEKELDYD